MKKLMFLLLFIPSLCSGEYLKFFLSVDSLSGETSSKFKSVTKKTNVEYAIVNSRENKDLYICIIKDGKNIDSFIDDIESMAPSVLGKYKVDGKKWSDDEKDKLKKNDFLSLMKDKKTYDVNGIETKSERPTETKETVNFSGWKLSYEINGIDIPEETDEQGYSAMKAK